MFLAMMTATAADVAPKPTPEKVVEQQLEESYSLKLLNTAKRARSKLQLKTGYQCRAKDDHLYKEKHRNNALESSRRFCRTTGNVDFPQCRFSDIGSF